MILIIILIVLLVTALCAGCYWRYLYEDIIEENIIIIQQMTRNLNLQKKESLNLYSSVAIGVQILFLLTLFFVKIQIKLFNCLLNFNYGNPQLKTKQKK